MLVRLRESTTNLLTVTPASVAAKKESGALLHVRYRSFKEACSSLPHNDGHQILMQVRPRLWRDDNERITKSIVSEAYSAKGFFGTPLASTY